MKLMLNVFFVLFMKLELKFKFQFSQNWNWFGIINTFWYLKLRVLWDKIVYGLKYISMNLLMYMVAATIKL